MVLFVPPLCMQLLCVTAAPAPDGVPAFVPPVGLTLSVQGQPPVICDPEANTSNATRVCGIVPSLHELCGDGNATQVEACVTYGVCPGLCHLLQHALCPLVDLGWDFVHRCHRSTGWGRVGAL